MTRFITRSLSFLLALVLAGALYVNADNLEPGAQYESGAVLQTMDAANYTYMLVRTDTKDVWVAIPAAAVKVGEQITFRQGMVMENFQSKALGKTFDSVIFSPGLAEAAEMPDQTAKPQQESSASPFTEAVKRESGQPEAAVPQGSASAGSAGAAVPFMEISVDRVTGENGYTVEEIFGKAKKLDGKPVRVRGKVVKVSPNIMGKNWIHIQDGTGDPMQNSHDLVITTQATADLDDVIVAEGTLAADKDFGFGYEYQAIVEEATISN